MFLIASALNTEKNPNSYPELKIIASSNKIKFWSAAPPLTLKPVAPSPPLETPGRRVIDLIISTSPKAAGILFIEAIESLFTLICGPLMLSFSISSSTITSISNSKAAVNLKSCVSSFSICISLLIELNPK